MTWTVQTVVDTTSDYGNENRLTVSIESGDGKQYRNMRRLPKRCNEVELVAARLEELAIWLRAVAAERG